MTVPLKIAPLSALRMRIMSPAAPDWSGTPTVEICNPSCTRLTATADPASTSHGSRSAFSAISLPDRSVRLATLPSTSVVASAMAPSTRLPRRRGTSVTESRSTVSPG